MQNYLSINTVNRSSLEASTIYLWILVSNLLIFVNPLFSISLQLVFLWFLNPASKYLLVNLIVSLALFLGLINSTKIPASDMVDYLYWYSLVPSTSFIEYVWIQDKEPAYHALVYAIGKLLGNSQDAYVIGITFVGYLIFLSAVLGFGLRIKERHQTILAIIIFSALFPQLFSLSMHVVRQFLAGSVILLFIVSLVLENRKKWWLLVVAFLMHSSAIVFIPLALIPRFSRAITLSQLFYIVFVTTLGLYTATTFLAPLLLSVDSQLVSYVGLRLSQERFFELNRLGAQPILVIAIFLGFICYESIFRKKIPRFVSLEGYNTFVAIFIILSIFILVANVFPQTRELSSRFLFYWYFMVSIVLYFVSQDSRIGRLAVLIAPIGAAAGFWITLEAGVWTYSGHLERVALPLL